MKNRQKFWLVSELFYPDETATGFYITGIAKHLANFTDVNVICSSSKYEKKSKLISKEDYLPSNIYINYVKSISLDKNNLFLRVIRFVFLTFSFAYKILTKIQKGDKVCLVTNPASIVPVAVILSKIKKFELTILVHDVFPENLVPVKLMKSAGFVFKMLKKTFDVSYRNVDSIIVCGRDMEKLFLNKGCSPERLFIVENWADTDKVFPILENSKSIYDKVDISDKIVFQYAGNIGRLQGLEELLDIISKCSNSNIYFVFVGEGALKNTLIEKSKALNLTNVSFMESFERGKQNLFLNACDVAIVSLYDNMLGLGVPSKSYNIMAAGKPILYIGNRNGEIANVVKENKIGWHFELAQNKEILSFLNSFNINDIGDLGKTAREVSIKKYSRELILNKYEKVLNLN